MNGFIGTPAVIAAAKVQEGYPRAYRLGKRNGEIVLQGVFFWHQGFKSGHEWRDIPIVDLDSEDQRSKAPKEQSQ